MITIDPYESDVDRQIREAQERGDFDNLKGAGKPIPGLGGRHDPDWWIKQMMEREDIHGVLPPSLALRKASAELLDDIAGERSEARVREIVAQLNEQITRSQRDVIDGPPVFLRTHDVEKVVADWKVRREAVRPTTSAQSAGPVAGPGGAESAVGQRPGLLPRIRAWLGRR